MLTIRYRPEAATPALATWLRPKIRYDADGRFSMYLVNGVPLPPELAHVARIVCPDIDSAEFCVVALQAYRDGTATTPCHSDAPVFGFILSIGATRMFRVHRGTDCENPLEQVRIECVNGMAILMDGWFHKDWHHQLMPDAGVTEERLSLVFRTSKRGFENG